MSKTIIKIRHADIHIAGDDWRDRLMAILGPPCQCPVSSDNEDVREALATMTFALDTTGDGMLVMCGDSYVPTEALSEALEAFVAWMEAGAPPCGIPGVAPASPIPDPPVPDGPPAGGGGGDTPGQGDDPPVAEVDV